MILTSDYGVTSYDIGTGFGHFAIATPDVSLTQPSQNLKHHVADNKLNFLFNFQVYKLVEDVKAKGGQVTREAGPVKGGTTVIAFVKDPDGYLFEIIERPSTPEPLCQVMLRVGDLERSIKFYEKVKVHDFSFLLFMFVQFNIQLLFLNLNSKYFQKSTSITFKFEIA